MEGYLSSQDCELPPSSAWAVHGPAVLLDAPLPASGRACLPDLLPSAAPSTLSVKSQLSDAVESCLRASSWLRGQVTQSLSLELGHKLCPPRPAPASGRRGATGGSRVPLVPDTCPAREEPRADHPAASVNCQISQASKQTTQLKKWAKNQER